MARRGESIYKRKDGRWEARYIERYDEGKAKYRYIYARTYAEAKKKRVEAQNLLCKGKGGVEKTDIVFADLAHTWLEKVQRETKESTSARYFYIIEHYLPTYLKMRKLCEISIEEICIISQKLILCGGKNGGPLSAKTVSDVICVLKAILRFGREAGYACVVPNEIKLPRRSAKCVCIIPKEKLEIVERELWSSDSPESIGILLALFCGMRIGEVCGVCWGDIDFSAKSIAVRRTVERIPNFSGEVNKTKVIISEPKTSHSVREIPLPYFLLQKLQKSALPKDFFIVTGARTHTEPHSFYMRYKTFMRRLGMEEYTFHALRHTFATRCVELGFDAKALSEILGHANVSTTLAVYVHPTLEQKRAQMERFSPPCT
ncbi:MAG: site-specific integrase [Clostridia bacterium]|nr:site-specific integrase [Clostridia bacterium]